MTTAQLSYDDYVSTLADLLSGEPDRVRTANDKLFHVAVGGNGADFHPTIALADVEQQLEHSIT